jgi:GNAT superfamily N-acetyltransferase
VTPYWTNRLARPDEQGSILNLVRALPGERYQNASADYWRWRYFSDTPFAADVILAKSANQPVGTQPVSFFDWQWGASGLKGGMYTGVLTHPDHRRRGIFHSLIDSSNDLALQRGAQFCMTMPNDESLPGFLKFGDWRYPGVIPMWIKVLDGKKLLASKLGIAAGAPGILADIFFALRKRSDDAVPELSFEHVQQLPTEFDEIANAFSHSVDALMIRRTADYWNWRYSGPLSTYQTQVARESSHLVGAVVTTVKPRFGVEMGMILDLVAAGGLPVLRSLIRAAESDLVQRGVGISTCQASSPLLQRALRDEGYYLPRGRLMPKKFHFVYRLTGVSGLPREPAHIEEWHLTFGDSDNV